MLNKVNLMIMSIKSQIESYERMLGNIEYHIETNGWSIDEKEMRHLKTRVRDYKDFIDVLKKLNNQPVVHYGTSDVVDFYDQNDIHISERYDNSISMYFGQVITGKTTHTTSDKFTRQEAFRAALTIAETIFKLKNK